jgi:hypothetical protein
MDPYHAKTSSVSSFTEPAGLRITIRGAGAAGRGDSRQSAQPSIRITRGGKVERIFLDAKRHVIMQFRQAQQASSK